MSAQSRPTLYDPMDCNPPGSSVHGILQARILEWDAMPSSRDWTHVSCIGRWILYRWTTRETQNHLYLFAITETTRLGGLHDRNLLCHSWRLEVQDQGIGRYGFPRDISPRLAEDHFLLYPHMSFSLCVHFPAGAGLFSYENTSHTRSGLHHQDFI